MDCNKEEARRAKEIAERKMLNKDFLGAKSIVLKAQQLFPDLENISQMLTVCEVHCCAAAMVNGERDWYGILQVEQAADESFIKKQYRRLALQLHPDKNKFAGAEAAFKLIGEAHMTLSDRGKRLLYDSKRRLSVATVPRQPSHQPTRPYFAKMHPGVPGNFPSMATPNFVNINQQQSSASNSQSFWTACAMCGQRYEYLRTLINRSLRCQRCLKYFTAREVHMQAASAAGANSTQPLNPTQNFKQEIPRQQRHTGNSSNIGFKETVAGAPTAQNSWSSSGINVAHGGDGSASKDKQNGMAGNNVHFEKVNLDQEKERKPQVKCSKVNVKRKRGSKSVESSDSSDSDGSTDSEDILDDEKIGSPAEPSIWTTTGHYPRRSNRAKQNVAYNEEAKEDEVFVSPKISKKNTDRVRSANDANHTIDSSSNDSEDFLMSFTYPDPEFGNFEDERVESKFEVGQIWAAYDTLDAMPRYYARIREVFTGQFRLHFNWLEHNPVNDTEIAWTDVELPVASGNYRLGSLESSKSLQMFSHLMCWEKGTRKMTYDIYPRKGEVWALYKGWDVNWSADAENHRLYEYEVVEVISNLTDRSEFVVCDLVKIKGFQSLFIAAIDKGAYRIPLAEVLRFSHKVPSYRLTGSEKEGALKGSLELDVASLPSDFADAFPSISLDNAASKVGKFGSATINPCRSGTAEEDVVTCSKNRKSEVENINAVNGVGPNSNSFDSEHQNSPLPGTIDYPLCEFHDFEEDKSIDKIKRGQIWALYSDVDQYPKYYAKVKCVTKSIVQASWIELFPQKEDEIAWSKKGLPCACGIFKAESKVNSFDSMEAFSHMVQAVHGKKNLFDIYPRSGEVWALYKDWSMEWTQDDLENCDYDVVEVLERTDSVIRVLVLTKVDDHGSVFMSEKKGEAPQMLEIPLGHNLRFSHQIPAFRITNLESEKFQGCWELHSLSVPRKFL